MTATDTMALRPLLFPGDQQFWYETLRALGHTAYGGADIGEVVTTAARITAGDYGSWYEQWAATAQRTPRPRPALSWPAGYRGQGAVSPSGGPPSPRHHAPELMFCERGLTDAYFFSRHSYSAIRTVPDQISSHGL